MNLKRWGMLGGWLCVAVWAAAQPRFESRVLQQAADGLSRELPCAATVYRFAESYLNGLLAMPPQDRRWRLSADDVVIEAGRLENLRLVNSRSSLRLVIRQARAFLAIENGSFPVIRLSFPMSYQLIRQQNQKELEQSFLEELKAFRDRPLPAPDAVRRDDLEPAQGGLFVKRGNWYELEAVHNDRYYQQGKDGRFRLVCSPRFPVESLTNLLLEGARNGNFRLDLQVHGYGFQTHRMQVGLNQWIAYCRSQHSELYVGLKQLTDGCAHLTVFAVNSDFFYNHVMSIEFPLTALKAQQGELKAHAWVYVPTHNLGSLFDEMNQSQRKRKSKSIPVKRTK